MSMMKVITTKNLVNENLLFDIVSAEKTETTVAYPIKQVAEPVAVSVY